MPVFQHPIAFCFILLIPILYVLRFSKFFTKPAIPLVLKDWQGQEFRWKETLGRVIRFISGILFMVGYISLVFAFADPVRVKSEKVYTSRGTDILFVLDTSPSMTAKDLGDISRLDTARQAIKVLVPASGGTHFGLVAMASEAALIVPPTTDKKLFFERLDSLSPGSLGDGTSLGAGLSTAVYHLAGSPAPKKCIVLVTDGENNAGSIHPENGAALAREYGITLYVLGVGTQGAVPIDYVDPVSGKVYSGYLDSRFDASALEKIALIGKGRYFGVETSNALSAALEAIAEKEVAVQSFYIKQTEESLYFYFLGFALGAFVMAWVLRRLYMGEQL